MQPHGDVERSSSCQVLELTAAALTELSIYYEDGIDISAIEFGTKVLGGEKDVTKTLVGIPGQNDQ